MCICMMIGGSRNSANVSTLNNCTVFLDISLTIWHLCVDKLLYYSVWVRDVKVCSPSVCNNVYHEFATRPQKLAKMRALAKFSKLWRPSHEKKEGRVTTIIRRRFPRKVWSSYFYGLLGLCNYRPWRWETWIDDVRLRRLIVHLTVGWETFSPRGIASWQGIRIVKLPLSTEPKILWST